MAEATSETRKKLKESDLKLVLNDPLVEHCIEWKEVGIELGFKKSYLDKVGVDEREKTDKCKVEMLDAWLKIEESPTLNKLHRAIKRVQDRQLRKTHRDDAEDDGKRALEAIHETEGIIEKWRGRDEILTSDIKKLMASLQKEKEWMPKVTQWNRENREWKDGEIAMRRNNLVHALKRAHNLKNHPFVRQFLQSKEKSDPSSVKDEIVEGMLRQALAEIDIDRSRMLRSRYKEIGEHQRRLSHINTEVIELSIVLDKRLIEYDQIITGLHNLGVKGEYLKQLRIQLKSLQVTARKCVRTIEECDQVYTEGQTFMQNWAVDMACCLESFHKNIEGLNPAFIKKSHVLSCAIIGMVMGAMIGAKGHIIAGAVLGLVVGAVAGIVTSLTMTLKEMTREVRNFKETVDKAMSEHAQLLATLRTP